MLGKGVLELVQRLTLVQRLELLDTHPLLQVNALDVKGPLPDQTLFRFIGTVGTVIGPMTLYRRSIESMVLKFLTVNNKPLFSISLGALPRFHTKPPKPLLFR